MLSDEAVAEGARLGGYFDIGEGRNIIGELCVSGTDTLLKLHDTESFHVNDELKTCIHGTLHNRTKVTLFFNMIRCDNGWATSYGERYYFAEVMPSYIVSGSHHLSPDSSEITKITFHVDDAEDIFDDRDAVGHVIYPERLIEAVVAANEQYFNRSIPIGPFCEVAYFAGRTELANFKTSIGQLRIFQRPILSNRLSSREVSIRSRTFVEITFSVPHLLPASLNAVRSILRFLAMLGGRPQNMDGLWLDTVGVNGTPPLALYWTHPPRRPAAWEEQNPDPMEILIPVVENPEEFASVLKHWLDVDDKRLDARLRFAECFEKQRSFPIDRLVGAANMFDIMPSDAFPTVEQISPDVVQAKETARCAFVALPDSAERQSILSALGRLGNPTLRSKVLQRARLVSNALSEPLTDLEVVVEEAIKCRNHYVHGTPGSFDYAENYNIVTFLTRSLEFLFAASDLIDAGWDIRAWRRRCGISAHPFSKVLFNWEKNASRIRYLRFGGLVESES